MDKSKYKEIWISSNEDGDHPSICALINGNKGWLMYLPDDDGGSFSSRNPNFEKFGKDDVMDFVLNNGQLESCPMASVISLDEIDKALDYFQTKKNLPPFIIWHDDSTGEIIRPNNEQ